MKKLVSLLLSVCMCLSVGVMLTACGNEEHTHTYKTEWSKDTTHHWHACEGEDCTNVADKAEHTWNEGEITTEATAEADGVKTFTCTVCGQTKNETIEDTVKATITKEEWDKALQATENGLFRYTMTMGERSGFVIFGENAIQSISPVGISEYYVKGDDEIFLYEYNEEADAFDKYSVTDSWEKTVSDYVDFVLHDAGFEYFEFELFSYNEEAQAYICEKIECPHSTDYIFDVSFKFSNGKITEATWAFNDTDGTEMIWYNSISYAASDIAITIPEFNINSTKTTVTEEEWENILIGDYLNNVTVNEQIVKRREGETEPYATTNNIWKHTEAAIYSADYAGDVFSNQYYYVKKDNVWYNLKEKTILGISAGWQGEAMSNEQAESKTFAGDIGVEFVDLYSSFTYNSENKCYEVFEDEFYVKIYIEEGKLVKFEMNSVITSSAEGTNGEVVNGTKIYEVTTYTFSDYGTTTIDNIPEWTVAS